MREKTGNKFLDDLFEFLDDMIETGAEVHIVDKSDPDNVEEHVFNAEEEEVPFTDDNCPNEDSPCESCEHFAECFGDEICDAPVFEPDMWGIPDIDRVVFSGPATIIFWMDGTKTVVKAMKGEKIEHYAGFAAACMKKMFGSTSRAKAIMNELAVEELPKKDQKSSFVSDKHDLVEAEAQRAAHNEAIQEAIDEALG